MRLEDFLKEVLGYRSVIISNITDLGWSWGARQKYAELTSLVDFGCDFDEDGVCKIHQHQKLGPRGGKVSREKINRSSRCCCGGCRTSCGYLRSLPNDTRTLASIAELFDEETGFWELGKGCVLPRKHRSNTCLFHMCIRQPSKSKKGDPFDLLRDMMRTPCAPDYLHHCSFYLHHCSLPPKTFKNYPTSGRSAQLEWIPYKEIKRMLSEDKVKRERKGKKTHGNN